MKKILNDRLKIKVLTAMTQCVHVYLRLIWLALLEHIHIIQRGAEEVYKYTRLLAVGPTYMCLAIARFGDIGTMYDLKSSRRNLKITRVDQTIMLFMAHRPLAIREVLTQ